MIIGKKFLCTFLCVNTSMACFGVVHCINFNLAVNYLTLIGSKAYLAKLFQRTLEVCSPEAAVTNALSFDNKKMSLSDTVIDTTGRPIYVLSVGKAAVPMYRSMEKVLDGQISDSVVIAPQIAPESMGGAGQVIESAHPVPDESSLKAGRAAARFFDAIPTNAIVLALISGGTSSLMCYPVEGIAISELAKTFELLNRSGATIQEINTVRKHCSKIKGGGLLRFLSPSVTLIDLIISDVPGDAPAVIGSGPTIISRSTYRTAHDILLCYELWEQMPSSIRQHIQKGIEEDVAKEGEGDQPLSNHKTFIVGSARQFAQQAGQLAREDGYQCVVSDGAFNDDVEAVASTICQKVESQLKKTGSKPMLFLFYGESTVTVTGDGKGGRNQELALLIGRKFAGQHGVSCLCAGTDGVDGPTDAAGAVVDGSTVPSALQKGIDPEQYLQRHDSYHFHQQMGTLLKTGATGNNLMDVVWVMVK